MGCFTSRINDIRSGEGERGERESTEKNVPKKHSYFGKTPNKPRQAKFFRTKHNQTQNKNL